MQTDHYRARLEEEKAKLEGELKGVGRQNPKNPNDWEPKVPDGSVLEADPVDASDATIGYDTNASIVADLETRYNEVNDALSRIEAGTYGVCDVSGEPIEEGRLNADPAARTCLKHVNP